MHPFFQNVSRETYVKLEKYVSLLERENKIHNLVSASTIEDVWVRHVLDSAQLFSFVPKGVSFLDLGSGAGFPGMVLAMMGVSPVFLLDARQKKCNFLEHVSRETKTPLTVAWTRIEDFHKTFDVIATRGFASLCKTFELSLKNLKKEGIYLFLKGKTYEKEIEEAKQFFSFDCEIRSSITSDEGKIILLRNVKRHGCTGH